MQDFPIAVWIRVVFLANWPRTRGHVTGSVGRLYGIELRTIPEAINRSTRASYDQMLNDNGRLPLSIWSYDASVDWLID